MLGGGAGHIADMVARYKANMSWLKKKRYFDKHRHKYSNRNSDWYYDFPHATPEELHKLRRKLIIQRRSETIKLIFLLIFSVIAGSTLMYWIFFMN